METRDLRRFRWKLEAYREETVGSLTRLGGEARTLDVDSPQDTADRSVASLAKEILLQQSSQRRALVLLIEGALHRMRDGTFGTCISCGDDIQLARLEALPWTQYCLRCQEMLEQDEGPQAFSNTPLAGRTWKKAG